jgi:hypothetical protein
VVGGSLHTHHIEPWSLNKALRFDLSNLVTLCKSCHIKKAHGGSLKFGITDPVVAEFLKQYTVDIYVGGGVEKNGSVLITDAESEAILSGVIPDRIARDWSDLTLQDLAVILNRQTNTEKEKTE